MNRMGHLVERVEYYRSNELPVGDIESPRNTPSSTTTQTRSAIERQSAEDESMSQEREKKIELWMENVKAFIREIDVGSL